MNPLPQAAITAAQCLTSHGAAHCLSLAKLREIVQAHPSAAWETWGTWHLREDVSFDGSSEPVPSFIASFCGSKGALDHAGQMLVLKRALEQHAGANPHRTARASYALVLEVKNSQNSALAWLDCESGVLTPSKRWPAQDAAPPPTQ
jgi:hypothetical protein